MGWYSRNRYDRWAPYVSVADRKENAAKKVAQLKKKGQDVSPVVLQGRTIANTFWGKAWCHHLESYSDYENRLPRGRSYVRNGSVIDLKIQKGQINAMVSGSSIYNVDITIKAVHESKWKSLVKQCAGKIDSLIELLQGKFSKAVMEIITHKEQGLFPHPNEIKVDCSCPDYASMCKHVAAVLYGVGARLDSQPEHLFLLRQVDHIDLITEAAGTDKLTQSHRKQSKTALDESDLSSLFGIDIDIGAPEKSLKDSAISKTKKSTSHTKKLAKTKKAPTTARKKNTKKPKPPQARVSEEDDSSSSKNS